MIQDIETQAAYNSDLKPVDKCLDLTNVFTYCTFFWGGGFGIGSETEAMLNTLSKLKKQSWKSEVNKRS